MKHILLSAVALVALCPLSANAENIVTYRDPSSSPWLSYYLDTSTLTGTVDIHYYEDNFPSDLLIKGNIEYNGENYTITTVLTPTNRQSTGLTSVTLGEGIEVIEGAAFSRQESLSSISLPQSLRQINNGAFMRSGLTSLVIPDGVHTIEGSAFSSCTNLKSVTLPKSLRHYVSPEHIGIAPSIDEMHFYSCTSLINLVIPEGIEILSTGMFYGCSSLQEINLPSTLSVIRNAAFAYCYNLRIPPLHNGITTLGYLAFCACNITGTYVIPKNVTILGEYALLSTGLSDLVLEYSSEPITITTTKNQAPYPFDRGMIKTLYLGRNFIFPEPYTNFDPESFSNLTMLTVADGIDASTVFGPYDDIVAQQANSRSSENVACPLLEHLTIGHAVTGLPQDMTGFTALKSFTILSDTPPVCPVFSEEQYQNITLNIPVGSASIYSDAAGWKDFVNIVEYSDPSSISATNTVADSSKTETGRYDMMGRRVNDNYKGMVIVRYDDGTSSRLLIH